MQDNEGQNSPPTPSLFAGTIGNQGKLEPNELLKIFIESADKPAVAQKHRESLTEKFFIVADSLMGMVSYTSETDYF